MVQPELHPPCRKKSPQYFTPAWQAGANCFPRLLDKCLCSQAAFLPFQVCTSRCFRTLPRGAPSVPPQKLERRLVRVVFLRKTALDGITNQARSSEPLGSAHPHSLSYHITVPGAKKSCLPCFLLFPKVFSVSQSFVLTQLVPCRINTRSGPPSSEESRVPRGSSYIQDGSDGNCWGKVMTFRRY